MTQHNGGAPAVSAVTDLKHRVTRMTGRDPHEGGRAATNLELFFDLTFVVAFAFAGAQVSHYVAEGHYKTAVLGFVFTMFAAIWCPATGTAPRREMKKAMKVKPVTSIRIASPIGAPSRSSAA